jgi:alpha-amylase
MRVAFAVWLVAGCTPHDDPALALDGPTRVTVASLGPVEGPRAVLPDGSTPPDIAWTASVPAVADIRGSEVIAKAGGETQIIGAWSGQEVRWTLVVEPAVLLVPDDPPATVAVGSTVPLRVHAHDDDGKPAALGALRWVSSDPSVATVTQDGAITGIAPGIVYVTVSSAGSDAMLEIRVVP